MHKNAHGFVSRLILRKTNSYLRLSVGLYVLSLMLLSTAFVFSIDQYALMNRELIRNANIHIIRVNTKSVADSGGIRVDSLNFQDQGAIRNLIIKRFPRVRFTLFQEDQLNFGVEAVGHQRFFIDGMDRGAAQLLGPQVKLLPDVAYGLKAMKRKLVLRLPVIQVHSGGMSSSRVVNVPISYQAGVSPSNPFSILADDSTQISTLFVDASTFKRILETAFHVKWDAFVNQYDQGNPYGIQAVQAIYVYVDNITQVSPIAELLNAHGYSANYILKAFHDVPGTVATTVTLASLMAGILVLITAVNVWLSFRSYLKIQQKDMGILKHLGFSSTNVYKIYARNINRIFILNTGLIIFYTVVLGLWNVPAPYWADVALLVVGICLFMLLISRFILFFSLRKFTDKRVLDLMKWSKEFE